MTPQQATEIVQDALLQIAPEADLAALAPDTDFRDALELDSLDFLSYVEVLSETGGVRVDEDDYPKVSTIAGAAAFIAAAGPR
ncbi:phosphopantetheine-binding protein [Actinomadura sp. ATCC 31491]|uniref:Phosphopantetheine-binding protein n=1 Tax=Actinomadura luzonensis TaxID=2805427 RepID=A0ABT0G122_9ACTN|nr:phosphopantetheine-binding protein [Actinomadura luzonensis]MCK2218307.1 phosphopantetheine-binding protein [Actinomadura luzonensis]